MSLKSIKSEINSLKQDKLKDEILYLYKNFKQVKDYYDNKYSEDSDAVFQKFKIAIRNEFFPTRGNPKKRLSVARKVISDFKKVCKNPTEIADLMIFYVETGVKFTNTYGDIDEAFYNSMESMFETALKFMQKNNILDNFKDRAEEIVEKTVDIGWGFHDSLVDLVGEYY